ncbi:hypothetical protein YC2023_066350 [Brassica napus]
MFFKVASSATSSSGSGSCFQSLVLSMITSVSVSTHRTSVAVQQTSVGVRQHTQDVHGCPCVYVCVHQHTQDVCGCLSVHILARCTHKTSVGVRQHTQFVRGCPWLSVSTHMTSVAVRVCPCVTHIRTLILGLSTLALPVDCLGDFGPRGLSVQYTQDVRGCPPAYTGRPWLSISTHRTSVAVRVCLWVSASTHRTFVAQTELLWLSISTHISTLALPVDCLGDFGPSGLSVQCTQDVCGCPLAHTGRPCVSVSTQRTSVAVCLCPFRQHAKDVCGCLCVSVCVRQHTYDVHGCPSVHISARWTSGDVYVCPSAHTGCLWLSINTHISTLILGLSTLTLPVHCSGDFGPRGLSGQYTHDVRVCPSAHKGRLWLSVCVCLCPSAHTGRLWLSIIHTRRPWVSASTHRSSVAVCGYPTQRTSVVVRVCPCVSLGVRQQTQDVRGYLSTHTGRPCVSVSTHRTSVCVRQQTERLWLSISTHISTLVLGLSTLALPVDCLGVFGPRGLSVQYTHDVCGCPSAHTGRPCVSVSTQRTSVVVFVCSCVYVSTHMTSMAVHQYTYQHYTQDVCGCPSAHTGRPCVSVSTHRTSGDVCVYPSAHTGCPWLSINTHISTLVLGLSTLTLPVHCSGDFGPRGLSGQYTPDVRGTHISTLVLGLSTLALPVDCLGDFGPRGLSVQYTQDVRGCPSAHTGRPCVSVSTQRTSVAVCVCSCVYISTHMTSMAVHQYTYQHVVPWTQHADLIPWNVWEILAHVGCVFSTHRMSVGVRQHTKDVRGYPSAHTGRPWLSVCARVCLCVSVSTHRTSVAVHQYTYQHHTQDVRGCPPTHTGRPWLSVAIRQHTHDVRRPWVSVSTHRTFVAVRVCPSAHTGRSWLSISTHISTLVLGLSTLTLPVDGSGDFGPCGLSVQYTQDVRGCLSAHTGRPCVSVSTQRTSVAVSVCPCVYVSTHMTSMAVHQYTYQHVGPWTQHADPIPWIVWEILAHVGCVFSTHRMSVGVRQHTQDVCGTHISTLVVGLSTLTLPMDYSGDFGPRGLSVQYTQDVHGCPPAQTGRPWLSVAIRQHTHDVRGCPCVSVSTHRTSVGVRQQTQDVRGFPLAHTGRPWLSVCVRQHTQDVRGCPSVHISARWSLDSAR